MLRAAAEMGIEKMTNKVKIGDSRAWNMSGLRLKIVHIRDMVAGLVVLSSDI